MAAEATVNREKSTFSAKAFLQGLAVVTVVYLLLALYLFLNAGNSLQKQESRLASQTSIVEWKAPPQTKNRNREPYGPPEPKEAPPIDYSAPQYLESGLVAAPIDGLYENTPDGHKPIIRQQDGLTPFKAYRRPFDIYAAKKPLVSIVVAGIGLSDIASESAVRTMPPAISFAVSPYAETIDFWTKESRARGHEVWLTLPVESQDYPTDDPGPHTMLVGAPERENMAKLQWLLTRVDGYIGFITNSEPVFMKAANDMRPVVGAIYNRGLGFVDGDTDPSLIPQTMAVGMKEPYSNVNVWVDMPDSSQEAIQESLDRLEKIAKSKGYAVGVIHPLPVSYQQVLKWIKTLPDKGLALAPLSATTGY